MLGPAAGGASLCVPLRRDGDGDTAAPAAGGAAVDSPRVRSPSPLPAR